MEYCAKYIRVCGSNGQHSTETPAEQDGTALTAAALNAFLPGVTGLEFRPGNSSPRSGLAESHGDGEFGAPGGSDFGRASTKGG